MTTENAFEALCRRASQESWCWDIGCGTCRHAYFRCAFVELAKGKHPADPDWLPGKQHHHEMFELLFGPSVKALRDPAVQRAFSAILAGARIERIARACTAPDWLGYLGLGLYHATLAEREEPRLTRAWIPQLIALLRTESSCRPQLETILTSPNGRLRWQDLDGLEFQLALD